MQDSSNAEDDSDPGQDMSEDTLDHRCMVWGDQGEKWQTPPRSNRPLGPRGSEEREGKGTQGEGKRPQPEKTKWRQALWGGRWCSPPDGPKRQAVGTSI